MLPIRIFLLSIILLLAACQGQDNIVEVTVVVTRETETEVTATPAAAVEQETPAAQESPAVEATPSLTTEPESEPTATLLPLQATIQAMANSVTVVPGENSSANIAPDDYVALTDQACQIVSNSYVRDDFNGVDWPAVCQQYREQAANIESQEAFWQLMDAFIDELGDQHSRFVRSDSFAAEFDLPAEGSGVAWPGFTFIRAREVDRHLIWNVCQNGAAANAGLQRGDEVMAVNGISLAEMEEDELNRILYSGQESEAALTVQQGPGSDPAEITLDYGAASSCDGWSYGLLSQAPRIGYIRVRNFSGNSDTNIMEAINLMEDGSLDGLVLDVRHNPGGNADQDIAIFTTGQFGLVGSIREDSTQTIYRIRGPVRWNETTPVAVVTDGASHSAAEYFSTAMQQAGRAVIVGMPTAGNTEGISGFNLADGSLIRLAVSTLQLPDGSFIEGIGVIPDIQVPLGDWGLREVPDVQLMAAYEALLEEIQ